MNPVQCQTHANRTKMQAHNQSRNLHTSTAALTHIEARTNKITNKCWRARETKSKTLQHRRGPHHSKQIQFKRYADTYTLWQAGPVSLHPSARSHIGVRTNKNTNNCWRARETKSKTLQHRRGPHHSNQRRTIPNKSDSKYMLTHTRFGRPALCLPIHPHVRT